MKWCLILLAQAAVLASAAFKDKQFLCYNEDFAMTDDFIDDHTNYKWNRPFSFNTDFTSLNLTDKTLQCDLGCSIEYTRTNETEIDVVLGCHEARRSTEGCVMTANGTFSCTCFTNKCNDIRKEIKEVSDTFYEKSRPIKCHTFVAQVINGKFVKNSSEEIECYETCGRSGSTDLMGITTIRGGCRQHDLHVWPTKPCGLYGDELDCQCDTESPIGSSLLSIAPDWIPFVSSTRINLRNGCNHIDTKQEFDQFHLALKHSLGQERWNRTCASFSGTYHESKADFKGSKIGTLGCNDGCHVFVKKTAVNEYKVEGKCGILDGLRIANSNRMISDGKEVMLDIQCIDDLCNQDISLATIKRYVGFYSEKTSQ